MLRLGEGGYCIVVELCMALEARADAWPLSYES